MSEYICSTSQFCTSGTPILLILDYLHLPIIVSALTFRSFPYAFTETTSAFWFSAMFSTFSFLIHTLVLCSWCSGVCGNGQDEGAVGKKGRKLSCSAVQCLGEASSCPLCQCVVECLEPGSAPWFWGDLHSHRGLPSGFRLFSQLRYNQRTLLSLENQLCLLSPLSPHSLLHPLRLPLASL